MSDKQDCFFCEGTGAVEGHIRCTGACDWCGGCVDLEECVECEGTGEVPVLCVECETELVNGKCTWCAANDGDEQC